jgi:hypothetical protein
MSRHAHFYDAATGVFIGRSFTVTENHYAAAAIKANTPAGHAAFEGDVDPLAQRVDLATGNLVDYQPPQPSADHEWDASTKRWQLTAAAAARKRTRAAALQQIHALEQSQHAAVRDALLGRGTDRLKAIDDQIAELRKQGA